MTERTTNAEPALAIQAVKMVDEPPPFGGSWLRLYVAVIVHLILLIVILEAFTRAFI